MCLSQGCHRLGQSPESLGVTRQKKQKQNPSPPHVSSLWVECPLPILFRHLQKSEATAESFLAAHICCDMLRHDRDSGDPQIGWGSRPGWGLPSIPPGCDPRGILRVNVATMKTSIEFYRHLTIEVDWSLLDASSNKSMELCKFLSVKSTWETKFCTKDVTIVCRRCTYSGGDGDGKE